MTFDDMLDRVYDDHDLVEWVENVSRETLELQYMELVARYRLKFKELRDLSKCIQEVHYG
jgi:hypothetical protein